MIFGAAEKNQQPSGQTPSERFFLKIDRIPTRDLQTIADALVEYFHGISAIDKCRSNLLKDHPNPQLCVVVVLTPRDQGKLFNQPYSMAELNNALSRVKGSSAG